MLLFRRACLPSIRSKLFTLVLASVLPILLGYVVFVRDAARREAQHVARDAQTVTRALAAALERDLESAQTAAQVAAAWPTLAPGTLDRFHAQARGLLRPEFAVSSFVLSGADGRALLDTRHAFGSAVPAMPNQDSIDAVLHGGGARVSHLYRPAPGLPFVFSSDVPVWRDGKLAYVLSTQVRASRVAGLLGTRHLPPGWIAEVIDGRGLVVARSVDAAFSERIDNEWRRAARARLPMSLILADIDHFKLFNDHYGHQAGDAGLEQVAHAMCRAANRAQDLVARYGGEEFAILLPETDSAGAACVARRVLDELAALGIAHAVSPSSAQLTASMGIASLVPDRSETSASLIRAADASLYQAKAEGRNRFSMAPPPAA